MPLDAQDKLTLETVGRAWDKAIQDTGASEMRAKLAVSGRELTRAGKGSVHQCLQEFSRGNCFVPKQVKCELSPCLFNKLALF